MAPTQTTPAPTGEKLFVAHTAALLPAGEYNMKIVFHCNGGSEGGEDLVTYGKVTVTQQG